MSLEKKGFSVHKFLHVVQRDIQKEIREKFGCFACTEDWEIIWLFQ